MSLHNYDRRTSIHAVLWRRDRSKLLLRFNFSNFISPTYCDTVDLVYFCITGDRTFYLITFQFYLSYRIGNNSSKLDVACNFQFCLAPYCGHKYDTIMIGLRYDSIRTIRPTNSQEIYASHVRFCSFRDPVRSPRDVRTMLARTPSENRVLVCDYQYRKYGVIVSDFDDGLSSSVI